MNLAVQLDALEAPVQRAVAQFEVTAEQQEAVDHTVPMNFTAYLAGRLGVNMSRVHTALGQCLLAYEPELESRKRMSQLTQDRQEAEKWQLRERRERNAEPTPASIAA
jgi:DNA-binding IclR family transcriptional regulator